MSKYPIEKVNDAVAQFKSSMEEGLRNISKACKLYVEVIDANPDASERFRSELPFISEACWANFELVGRGLMHQELIWGGGRSANKLKELPYSQQKRAIEEGIDVLVSNDETLRVKPENLTAFQVKQVFNGRHIRDVAEQRAYMESLKVIDHKIKQADFSYSIVKGELVVKAPTRFSKTELVHILGEML